MSEIAECSRCLRKVFRTEVHTLFGRVYHSWCVRCEICGTGESSGGPLRAHSSDGKLYCRSHLPTATGQQQQHQQHHQHHQHRKMNQSGSMRGDLSAAPVERKRGTPVVGRQTPAVTVSSPPNSGAAATSTTPGAGAGTGGGGRSAGPLLPRPGAVRDGEGALVRLVGMGYRVESALEALRMTAYQGLEEALQYLLSHPTAPTTSGSGRPSNGPTGQSSTQQSLTTQQQEWQARLSLLQAVESKILSDVTSIIRSELNRVLVELAPNQLYQRIHELQHENHALKLEQGKSVIRHDFELSELADLAASRLVPLARQFEKTKNKQQKLRAGFTCVKCHQKKRRSILLPCSHLALCKRCDDDFQPGEDICPICHSSVTSKQFVKSDKEK